MSEYERQRAEKIKRNRTLIQELGLPQKTLPARHDTPKSRPPKRRKLEITAQPTRTSARIAATPVKPSYSEDDRKEEQSHRPKSVKPAERLQPQQDRPSAKPALDIDELRKEWTSWEPSASPPTRDDLSGTFHFDSHPTFLPNKSPEEMLREGVFGGSYFRPLYSARLRATIEDDWKELPSDWTSGLGVAKFLTSPTYDPGVNKYKASCGQSIEQWEANGWIDHRFDVRGWFQWYCRFFQGRRCDDDERQVGRWERCVGARGRWRRALLKKYRQLGIRSVMADMDDDDGGDDDEKPDVSPTVHQTCLQWAFEVRQGVLDEFWSSGGA